MQAIYSLFWHFFCSVKLIYKTWQATERFTDMDKLNLVKFAYGGLVLGLCHFLLLPQNDGRFKSGQKRLENNHFVLLDHEHVHPAQALHGGTRKRHPSPRSR